jgi:hypothetical protein
MRHLFSAALSVGAAFFVAGCGGNGSNPPATLTSAYMAEAETEDAGFYLVLDNAGTPEDGVDGTFVAYVGEEVLFADVTDMRYDGRNLSFHMINADDPTDWAEFHGTGNTEGLLGEWTYADDEETRAPDAFPGSFSGQSASGTTGRFQGNLPYMHQLGGNPEKTMVRLDITGFLPPVKKGKPARATGHLKVFRNATGEVMTDEAWTGDYTAGTTIQTKVSQWQMEVPLTVVFESGNPNSVSVRYGHANGRIKRAN